MKKNFILFFILIFFVIIVAKINIVQAQYSAEEQEAIDRALAMQAQITAECESDPHTCSCEGIPCGDILSAEHERAQEAYDRCLVEKNNCETQRQNGIKEMEEQQAKIENQCRQNLEACDCTAVTKVEGKKKCELAIIEAKYQAQKEREDKIRECQNDLEGCNCQSISDNSGRLECETKTAEAREFKNKMMEACRADVLNCDCSVITEEAGRKQCEEGKKKGMEEAENAVKDALSKCFKDVEACNCRALDLPEEKYISFCEIQKTFGLNCKHEGLDCDKLENVEIYPPGMPAWLGKFFAKSYKDYIEKEKAKGAKEAAGIINKCLTNPAECQCEATPTYARAFCEKNKALQVKCENGDYDACIILDKTPNLPEGVPSFSYSLLDKLVDRLRTARKQLTQSNAARKVGNMIIACMDNSANCDCSLAPSGSIKSFCEHKKNLVELCRGKKHYESCFALDEEPLYPVETPDIIRNYIMKNIAPTVVEKKQKIFNEMKKGTVCENVNTLSDCKTILQR